MDLITRDLLTSELSAALIAGVFGLLGVAYAARYGSGWTRAQRLLKQLVDDLTILDGFPSGRARREYRELVLEKALSIAICPCVLLALGALVLALQPGELACGCRQGRSVSCSALVGETRQ